MDIKRHDWLATIINQPQFDFEDMQEHGITPDNTTIKSRDYYKSLPQIQQLFSDKDGKFDEETFNNYYLGALQSYNEYANNQFTDEMIKSYDPYDWTAPIGSKKKDTSVTISIGDNPERKSYGISNLKEIGKSDLSIREIAQTNKVWDPVSESFLDWSPNDKGGFFKALNRPTLALAIYDEDGTHEINGRTFRHKKGDMRLNEKGEPFYEIITPDKEIYGRDVLHYTDTFTIDGSKWNKYDFFDSDGVDKSIGGTIMKTAVGVAPMLIPGVGTVFGLASAGLALTQLLPVLGKSISNLVNGDKDTDFERVLTKVENWGAQFQSSVSDKSREKIATWENLGQLVKDVSLQLFQQQSIGKIPLLFGKTEKNAELGRNLALAYMAGTSAQQAYSSFKEAGANDRVAGIGMLASVFAMWKLMNMDYFRDSLFKGTFFDESIVKNPIKEAAKETAEAAKFMNPTKAFTWIEAKMGEKVANAARKTIGRLKDLGDPNGTANVFLMRALNEGIEETMEEVTQDGVNALFTGLDALGIPMTSSQDIDLNFGWNIGDALTRYLTSFVGGAIGGPIFELHNRWQNQLNNNITKSMDHSSFSQIAYLMAQGKRNEIDKYIELYHKRGKLGNKNLSGMKYEIKSGKDGKPEIVYEEAASGESQNDVVYNALKSYVNNLERIMEEEGLILPLSEQDNLNLFKGAILSPDSFKDVIDNEILERINTIGANSSKLNDLQKVTERIIKLRSEIDAITEKTTSQTDNTTQQQQDALKLQSNKRIQTLQKQLADARTQFEQIKNGDLNGYYLNQAKFALSKNLSDNFVITDLEKYSLLKTKTAYSALTPEQQEAIKEDFDIYMDNEAKYRVFKAYDIYLNASQAFAERIQQEDESLKNIKFNELFSGNVQGSVLQSLAERASKLELSKNRLQTKLDSGTELTAEEQKTLSEVETEIKSINKKEESLRTLPSSVLLDETVEDFSFFDRDHIQNPTPENLALYAKGLKEYYQYLADNKIISKGDKDLYFLMAQTIRPWAVTSLYERTKQAFTNTYFNIEKEILNVIDNGGDEDSYLAQTSTEIDGKEYNLVQDLLHDTGDLNFFKELEELVKQFNNAAQSNITEALNKYQEIIELFKKQPNFKDKAEKFVKQILPQINGQSIVDYLQEIKELKQNVKESSFLDLLNDFTIAINGEPIKLISLIKNEKQRLLDKYTLDDYVIEDENVEKQIAEVQSYLNILEALINGAYSGFNESINSTSKIYKLAVIGENAKNILNSEIETLRSELMTLSMISSMNKFRRLSIHQKVEVNMRPKFITQLKDYFTAFNEKFEINIEPLYEKYFGNIDFNNADIINWKDYEKQIIAFETELGQQLRVRATTTPKDFAKSLVSIFDNDIWKRKTTNLSDNKDEKDTSYDLLIHIAKLASINFNDFYVKYRERIIKNKKYNFAPILGQEQAIQLAYAYYINPELFNALNEEISSKYDGNDEYIKNKPNLYNIVKILGAAGSGKSSAIASGIYQMLSDEDVDYIYVAPGEEQLASLVKNITKEKEVAKLQFTKDDFLNQLCENGVKFKHNDTIKHFKGITEVKPKLGLNTGKKQIIFIDEISFFNEPELQLISDWAKQNNVLVIATGDQTQNSAKVNYEGKESWSGLEDVNIIGSTELGFTMRANSEAAIDNFQVLYSALKQAQDQYKDNPDWDIKKLDTQINTIITKGLNIKYYAGKTADDSPIVGNMFVEDDTDILNWVDTLNKTSKKDFLFITDNPDKWKSKLPDNVQGKILTPEKVQGLEATYVIVDVNWKGRSGDHIYNELRDLYTLSQRAGYGAIIKNNGIKDRLNITNLSDKLYKNVVEISEKQQKEFKAWREDALSNLESSGEEQQASNVKVEENKNNEQHQTPPPPVLDPNKKLEENSNQSLEPQNQKPGESPKSNDNEPGYLPNPTIETPKQEAKSDDSSNEQNDESENQEISELEDPMEDSTIPDGLDPDDSEIRGGGNYSVKEDNNTFIKTVFTDLRYRPINNDDYFYWSQDNLVQVQKNDKDSLFNFLGFTDEKLFLKFARQISGALLFNDKFNINPWIDRETLNNAFEGINSKQKARDFENLINYTLFKASNGRNVLNDDIYDLYVETIGDKNFVVIKWNLNGRKISLPIAIVRTNSTGKLANKHPFSLVRGAIKHKGSRTRTLKQVETEDRIFLSEPAILSANDKSVVNTAEDAEREFVFGVKDENGKYVRQPQNGKVFVQFTDNPNYDLNDFIENWRLDTQNGKVKYLYQNHDVCGLMGVHKSVNPETLFKAIIALYAVLIDSDAYRTALSWNDEQNAKTLDDKRNLQKQYLNAAGINSVEEAKRLIENTIPNFTIYDGVKPFMRFEEDAERLVWKEFFSYYSDSSRQVMNYNTLGRLITAMLTSFYNPDKYQSLDSTTKIQIRDNLFELLLSKPYASNRDKNGIAKSRSKNRIGINIKGKEFAIDKNIQGDKSIYTIYQKDFKKKLTKFGEVTVNSKDDLSYPLYQPLKYIFDQLRLDFKTEFNPENVKIYFNTIVQDVDKKGNLIAGTEKAYGNCVNETIYKLLRKVTHLGNIVKLINESGFFKDGFYANDVAGDPYFGTDRSGADQSIFRKTKESINNKGKIINGSYKTDVEIEGSIFSIDLTTLDSKVEESKPNEIQNYLDDVSQIEEFLKDKKVEYSIPVIFRSKILSQSNRDQLTDLINSINTVLKESALDDKYMQLDNSWIVSPSGETRLGELQIRWLNNPENCLKNALRNIGIYPKVINENAKYSYTGNNRNIRVFSVTLQNDQVQNFIAKKEGSSWNIKPFLSYDSYVTMVDVFNEMNLDEDQRNIISAYINSIQDDKTDFNIAENYRVLTSQNLDERLIKTINDYLLKRLENREC